MIFKVAKGTYEIIQNKPVTLMSDSLGAGIAIGFINSQKNIFGISSYLFPYRENDLELDEGWIYSGETLLNLFDRELEKLRINLEDCKWIIVGASEFRVNPEFLDLSEKNLKIAEVWFKRKGIWEQVIKKVKLACPLYLCLNGKEGFFEIKVKNRVERYE